MTGVLGDGENAPAGGSVGSVGPVATRIPREASTERIALMERIASLPK